MNSLIHDIVRIIIPCFERPVLFPVFDFPVIFVVEYIVLRSAPYQHVIENIAIAVIDSRHIRHFFLFIREAGVNFKVVVCDVAVACQNIFIQACIRIGTSFVNLCSRDTKTSQFAGLRNTHVCIGNNTRTEEVRDIVLSSR